MNLGFKKTTQIRELVNLKIKYKANLKFVKSNNNEFDYSLPDLLLFKPSFKKVFMSPMSRGLSFMKPGIN